MISLGQKHTAIIEIGMPTVELAETMSRVLKPGTDTKAQISVHNNSIVLNLEAGTKATLRALINSYLRIIIAVTRSLDKISQYQKDSGEV